MFCTNCGKVLEADNTLCPTCGTSMVSNQFAGQQMNMNPPQGQQQIYTQYASYQPHQHLPMQPQMHHQESKFPVWGTVLIVITVLMFLFICCAIATVAFIEVQNETLGNSANPVQRYDLVEQMAEIETDAVVMNSIAGEYRINVAYHLEQNTFERDDHHNVVYIFNSDGTFTIIHDMDCGCVFEGTFVAQRITTDDIASGDRRFMRYLGERADSDWYHIITYSDDFGLYNAYERFLSRKSTEDIIIYTPALSRSEIARQVQ